MNFFRLLISSLVFTFIFTASAFAQTVKPQISAASKIATINTEAFGDKTNGIQEIVDAYDKLDAEFKVEFDQLKSLSEVISNRQKEIIELSKIDFRVDYSGEFLNSYLLKVKSKSEELELLVSKYKEKLEKVKPLYEKRSTEIFGKIDKKIAEVMNEYAKENGNIKIVDVTNSSLPCGDGVCVCSDDSLDITKDFIKFYNERFADIKSQ
jgi:Skp family chaperone for outer membrane proteins